MFGLFRNYRNLRVFLCFCAFVVGAVRRVRVSDRVPFRTWIFESAPNVCRFYAALLVCTVFVIFFSAVGVPYK